MLVVDHLRDVSCRRLMLYLAGAFVLSRALFWAAGVRFDAKPLPAFWQYLDPELLRTRLWESILYLHSQPPLFNLLLGSVLKLAPGREALAFQLAYATAGFALYLILFRLLRLAGVGRPIALLLSTLFIVSPSAIAYENWLFYTYPLALVLVASAVVLAGVLERGRRWHALLFFSLLLLLGGIRSLFQLPYFLLIASGMILVSPGRRRLLLSAAAVPFVLLLSFHVKNVVLFGTFTTSSWLGMNTWGLVSPNLSVAERDRMVAAGELSAVALVPRFSPLEKYPAEYHTLTGFATIPAVRQVRKSTGHINYNHLAYLAISRQYLEDTVTVLRLRPRCFLVGVAKGWFSYFRSSSDFGFIDANLAKLSLWNGAYDYLAYGKIPVPLSGVGGVPVNPDPDRPRYLYLFLAAGLPMLVLYSVRAALRPGATRLTSNQRVLILYLCVTIAYVAFVGNLLESGENNRFRFMTDPFYVVLLGLFLQDRLAKSRRVTPARAGIEPTVLAPGLRRGDDESLRHSGESRNPGQTGRHSRPPGGVAASP